MPDNVEPLDPEQVHFVLDENTEIMDNDKLPIHAPIKVLRYRTIKKSPGFGWWSVIALLEDHGKKMVCFYRWRKKDGEWKRDKKIPFHSREEWKLIKSAVEDYMEEMQ
jgi:hypothetical protein